MRKSKFSEEQIVFILHQAEGGVPVAELIPYLRIKPCTGTSVSRRGTTLNPPTPAGGSEQVRKVL